MSSSGLGIPKSCRNTFVMACYAYIVLTQWFSSVCSGAGSETPLSKESKQGLLRHDVGMPRPELDIDFNPAQARLITRMGSG